MKIWCECSSFYKLNSYISNKRFPQWSSHLHSDTAEASLCRALGQKWALSLNWQPQSHFLPFSGYTLFLHALYPSSTVHAADSTWKLSYILPRALETNQYSHSGVLIAPRFAVSQLVLIVFTWLNTNFFMPHVRISTDIILVLNLQVDMASRLGNGAELTLCFSCACSQIN